MIERKRCYAMGIFNVGPFAWLIGGLICFLSGRHPYRLESDLTVLKMRYRVCERCGCQEREEEIP